MQPSWDNIGIHTTTELASECLAGEESGREAEKLQIELHGCCLVELMLMLFRGGVLGR